MIWEAVFWISLLMIAYPYLIYPAALLGINALLGRDLKPPSSQHFPRISVVIPVANEASRIEAKLRNIQSLDYPRDKVQIIVVGDGCTDSTLERARTFSDSIKDLLVISLPNRSGKAAALNAGVEVATGEVVVFTDAAIILEAGSLQSLVSHFSEPRIGCVSGEDYVEGGGSEGLYGRLELLLRREEARLHSIAGASGCFYAQRRELCVPFVPGMAPDFLSVLNTVSAGYLAICDPRARGAMTAATSQGAEFARKVRTFLRGITALFGNARLLNPIKYPAFSFILISHKLLRWAAPMPMLLCLLAAWVLRDQDIYFSAMGLQAFFYGLALVGTVLPGMSDRSALIRISAFFLMVNVAAVKALLMWMGGRRIEIWEPTRRPA